MARLFKLIVAALLIFFVWKVAIPWVKGRADSLGNSPTAAAVAGGNAPCIAAAQRATNTWGGGLGRFVNPPYDLDAWSEFHGDVQSKISTAESECSCDQDSCKTVRDAMGQLRDLADEFDSSIRNGSPPPESAVQRQDRIDGLIDVAAASARGAK